MPAFARQTGYYCTTCHTVQPELTPFGRQFKLNGYVSGGTRCGDIRKIFGNWDLSSQEWSGANLAMWVLPTFTNFQTKLSAPVAPGLGTNNIFDFSDATMFYAGQIYCNLGIFSQFSYASTGNPDGTAQIFWDNTELRYTQRFQVAGNDVLLGTLANNNPGMQDVWNTVPAWAFPWVPTDIPATFGPPGTMIEGQFAGRAYGAGFYTWINSMFYAEISGYRSQDASLTKLAGFSVTDGQARIDGIAPYWRLAIEKTWNEQSLMIGAYGMYADQIPTVPGTGFQLNPGHTDKFNDVAADLQYQYIGPVHAVTVRVYNIYETQKLDATFPTGGSNKPDQWLNGFNASVSYIYDRHISFTPAYFNYTGSSDATYWGGALGSINMRPDTNGYTFDLAYVPFPYGGPDFWPWLNARIGVLYTHYDKYAGSSANWDGNGRSARDNDTTFLYAWIDY
ncbi:MAG: hypothetical protein WAN43_06525 [Rhodomicrobium sp.]